jgi:hypothetical protein
VTGGGKIANRQTAEGQRDTSRRVRPHAIIIGAAVADRIAHSLTGRLKPRFVRPRRPIEHARDTAHLA